MKQNSHCLEFQRYSKCIWNRFKLHTCATCYNNDRSPFVGILSRGVSCANNRFKIEHSATSIIKLIVASHDLVFTGNVFSRSKLAFYGIIPRGEHVEFQLKFYALVF